MTDVGRRDIAQALTVSAVIVMLDEGADLAFEVAGQVIAFEQDAIFQGLMPAFNFALSLWVARCTLDMFDISPSQPFGKVACDVTRPVIGEQAPLVLDLGWGTARGFESEIQHIGNMLGLHGGTASRQ